MRIKFTTLLKAKQNINDGLHDIIIMDDIGERFHWSLNLEEIEDLETDLLDVKIQLRNYRLANQTEQE